MKFNLALWSILGILSIWGGSAKAAQKTYRIGVFMGLGGTQDVQGAEVLKTMTKVFTTKMKMKSDYLVYSDEEKFVRDVKAKKLDMAFTTRWDVFFGPMLASGFRPVISLKYFGKNEIPNCLFVSASSAYKTVQSLQGKRVATYASQTEYFTLREFIGGKPEKYFSPLVTFPNSISGLYQLGLGATDAAFVNRGVFQFLSLTNPGLSKQLRLIGCGKGFYSTPFTMGTSISKENEKKIIAILKNLPNDPAFSTLRPLAKGMNATFITVSKNEYLPMIQLRKKALQANWHLDHQKWLSEVKGLSGKIKTTN